MSARQIIFTYAWDMCRYAHADYKMSRPSSKLQKTFMRGQNMCVSQADEHRVRYGSYNKRYREPDTKQNVHKTTIVLFFWKLPNSQDVGRPINQAVRVSVIRPNNIIACQGTVAFDQCSQANRWRGAALQACYEIR